MEKARHEAEALGNRVERARERKVVVGKTELLTVIDHGHAARRELEGREQLGLFAVALHALEQARAIVIAEHPGGQERLRKVRLELADELTKCVRAEVRGERLEQEHQVQ